MARGDKRKRNIKRDWTSISIKSSNGAGAGAGGKQSSMMIPTMSNSSNMMIAGASNSTLQQGMSIAKSNQKNTLPNLKMVGKKMQKKIEKLKSAKMNGTAGAAMGSGGLTSKISSGAAAAGIVGQSSLIEMHKNALKRSFLFDAIQDDGSMDTNSNENSFHGMSYGEDAVTGKKDNSRKAYYREFKKVIQQSDVILEILDCRDPLGCRTREVEEMIMNAGADKKIVLILNKIDLVPKDTVEAWLKCLRNEFPTVAFKASTQSQRTNLGQSTVSASLATEALLGSSESIGADNLIKLLKNYCRNANMKTSITVGVVGFPNVGKSSVINSLKRAKVCGVGSTPGVTKVAQTIHLDKNINLLDCPGIVFSKPTGNSKKDSASVLLRNCVKVELLADPISPVELILERCSKEMVAQVYGIDGSFTDTTQFLVLYARQRGKLLKGGVPDIENAARCVIHDWNNGKIPFYTVPPDMGKGVHHVESSVVNELAAEFSLDGLMDGIVSTELPHAPIPIKSFGSSLVDMDEIDDEQDDMMLDSQPFQHNTLPSFQQPEIRFKLPTERAIELKERLLRHANSIPGPSKSAFTEEEALINPQIGQALKKLSKKARKDQRRALKVQMDEMEIEE